MKNSVFQKDKAREYFEKRILTMIPDADLSVMDKRYTDPRIEMMYQGFVMGRQYDGTQGYCIIGTYDDKNQLTLSERPAKHSSSKKATEEAHRLAQQHPYQRFVVFRSTTTVAGKLSREARPVQVGQEIPT